MKARKITHTPAALLRAAKAARVDEMPPEERRDWLNERGWTALDYYRAQLAARRAQHRKDPS